jgi:hypothetical protein
VEALQELDRQAELADGSDPQTSVRSEFNQQLDRRDRLGQFDLDEGGGGLGLGPPVTPAAEGGVADAALAGKGRGG